MTQGSALTQHPHTHGTIINLGDARRRTLYTQVKEFAATCHLIEQTSINCQHEGFASLETVEHIGFAVGQLKRELEKLALEIAND